MTDEKLIEKVVEAYDNARNLSALTTENPQGKTRVVRRRNRALGAFLEDVLGVYIGAILNDNAYSIWIDQTFRLDKDSVESLTKDKTFNPDITVVKNNEIIGFIEVKESANPFRWNSSKLENKGVEYVEDRHELFLEWLPGKTITYNETATSDERSEIKVCEKPFFHLVLFSNKLFSENKMEELRNEIKRYDKTSLFTLIDGYHPNINMYKGNTPLLKAIIDAKATSLVGLADFKKAIKAIKK